MRPMRSKRKPTKLLKGSKNFWDQEYKQAGHLALSSEPSEDLLKFLRYIEREYGRSFLNIKASALDLGCGNGRNLVYISQTYGMRGVGYDISEEAVRQAQTMSEDLPLQYEARSIAGDLGVADASQTVVLDMMTSHFLNAAERDHLVKEIARVLRPNGWLFFKTFLLDEDRNAERLLREHPGSEPGTYIHPAIGVAEHVFTEQEIDELLSPYFVIHKVTKSHRHLSHGRAFKRRSISVYAEKKGM